METAVVRRVQFPVFTGMILRRGEEIHYIGGADVLPAPLDIQTETLMIEKLQTDEFEEAKASLKKEFIDRKVPADMRDNVLVVSDDSGVLWAVGVRRSECALIDDETRNVLDITIQ